MPRCSQPGCSAPCAAGGPSQGLAPGWARPATPELTLAARHCYRTLGYRTLGYRTLARVDCHAQPLAAEASRRVGFFDAPVGP